MFKAAILLMAVLTLSVLTISIGQQQQTADASHKFFLATVLQYINSDTQKSIYSPYMSSEDFTRLRVKDQTTLESTYVTMAKGLPGPAGVEFKSSQAIVDNAAKVKSMGFTFIEFNLESSVSPSWDNNNVVAAMKKAADATHAQGLKFAAAPSKSYLSTYGTQIAPFSDRMHIQAQSLQDNGVQAYSED